MTTKIIELPSSTSSTSSTSSSSTSGAGARACVREDAARLAELVPLYERCVGRMSDYVAGEMVAAIERGLTADDIAYALRETACAPRPSWRYARAILDRLERGGERGPRKAQQTGHERTYDDRFFDGFFADLSVGVDNRSSTM